METMTKQSVAGFKVKEYQVKKGKDTEKVKLILEANVEDIKSGDVDFGEILKALWSHQASENDVGFSLFVNKRE
ncbi:hypothetical protein LCGC14_1599670 [marine sediment metagenome]|uniref:Uncharacterized protein n=1 Tax=marine sediment metagenome TaxID=412755 RepID=A0A0F9IXY9_9ZZZZ